MGLKLELASLDGVSEAVKELYVEKDGKYVLDAEGLDEMQGAKARLSEFRDNNLKLMKQLQDRGSLNDNEKAEMKRLQGIEKEYKDKQRIPISEMDTHVAARTKQLHEEFSTKLSDSQKQASTFQAMFESEKIGNVLRNEALKAGVLPDALDDVMNRGERVFKLKDGVVSAFDSKNELLYGKDGKALQVSEWFDGLSTTAKFLFAPNSGSGASGSTKGNSKVDLDGMSGAQRIAHGLRELGQK